ncbi:MAG: hypothetical protein R2685_10965 [Candidatus Nitrosocosmicus sp.]|nr:hypothetical protein [Candidatus Nitrosocosmicus sp.]
MDKPYVINRVKKLTEIAIPHYCQMKFISNKYELYPRVNVDMEKSIDDEVLKYLEENLK